MFKIYLEVIAMYVESNIVELKETYSDTIIRDIVAFLNADGGDIYIGIKDNGEIVGIEDNKIDEINKRISDIISSQIEPSCINDVSVSLLNESEKNIINLSINKGLKTLYCIKKYGFSSKGCLVRVSSTCKEMNSSDIEKRFQLKFFDDDYILQADSNYSPLKFEVMKILLTSKGYHINNSTFDINFNLKNERGNYNLMAEILADKNMVPLIFVKFKGKNKTSISQRSDYGDQSIILGLLRLKERLIAENVCVTDTTVRPRVDEYLYDMNAVNEVLVNAFVHNDWTISEPLVSFYEDRLEITSHGGLPKKITKDDFFNGVSHPRNTVLMRIFLKLGIVEHTGHGIPMIIKKYSKDVFDIHDSYLNVIIPFNKKVTRNINSFKADINKNSGVNINQLVGLTSNERKILLELIKNPSVSYLSLVTDLNISRRTVSRAFSSLVDKGYIQRIGNNKTGYWEIIK